MKHEVDKKRRMDDTKLLWHMDLVRDRLDHNLRVPPIHIDMGIAKFCNVNCVFCYGLYQQMESKFISREALLRAVNDAAGMGVKSIGFIGDGEPTCNPHVYDALAEGSAGGLDMSISTNGALLTSEMRRSAILENCKWMRFCISAGTRDGYQKIHGKDYFEKVVENIRETVALRDRLGLECEIGMQAVFVPTLMLSEMVKESELAVNLGVDYLVIKQCSLPDDGSTGMAQFDVNQYDDKEVLDTLALCEYMSNSHTDIIPKWNLMAQKGKKPYQNCKSISLISEVSGNGDWYPCGYMFGENSRFKEDFRFGNLEEQGLREIWESDRYWKIIERMENSFDVHKECHGCCRQDKCNEFCYNYVNKPKGINFI